LQDSGLFAKPCRIFPYPGSVLGAIPRHRGHTKLLLPALQTRFPRSNYLSIDIVTHCNTNESSEEIEKRMDELVREYVETHDPKIIEELYKLALELGRMLKE
jgi:hypothetical protein